MGAAAAPIEIRPVVPHSFFDRGKYAPSDNIWIKATGPVPGDVIVQQAVLAYASDMSLLDTALLPHGVDWHSGIQTRSSSILTERKANSTVLQNCAGDFVGNISI